MVQRDLRHVQFAALLGRALGIAGRSRASRSMLQCEFWASWGTERHIACWTSSRLNKLKAYRMLDGPTLDAASALIANFATPGEMAGVTLRKLSASPARKG